MGPHAVDDPTVLVEQAEEFAANNSMRAPYVDSNLLGAANYRAAHYERAAQCLEQSVTQFPSDPPPSHGTVLWPQMYLAMTKWQLGAHDDARQLLDDIQPGINEYLAAPTAQWQFRQITDVLRREAESLIGPEEAIERPDNGNSEQLAPTTDL